MITTFCLPDTTVVRNYGTVNRMDLLETYLDSRGRWVKSVWYEVKTASQVVRELRHVRVGELERFLGPPIEVTDAEAVEDLRIGRLGGPVNDSRKNLGEAETLHLIMTRPEFKDAVWISDDRSSAQFAKAKGIATVDTTGVMEWLCGNRHVSPQEGYRLLQEMKAAGNRIRMPSHPNLLAQ